MSKVQEHLEHVRAAVGKFMAQQPNLCQTGLFREAENAFGVPKEWFFLCCVGMVATTLLMVTSADLVINLLAFLYPAKKTLECLETVKATDAKLWLSYWTLFALYNIVETLLVGALLREIPFYPVLKLAAFAWLYHEQTRGAETVYELLRPKVLELMNREVTYTPAVEPGEVKPSGRVISLSILEARNLPSTNADGLPCSAYCLVKLLPKNGRTPVGVEANMAYKTSTCVRTANPVWAMAKYVIPLENEDVHLEVAVMDNTKIGNHHFLGSIQLDLEDVTDEFGGWLPLQDPKNKATWRESGGGLKEMAGELKVEMIRKTL